MRVGRDVGYGNLRVEFRFCFGFMLHVTGSGILIAPSILRQVACLSHPFSFLYDVCCLYFVAY